MVLAVMLVHGSTLHRGHLARGSDYISSYACEHVILYWIDIMSCMLCVPSCSGFSIAATPFVSAFARLLAGVGCVICLLCCVAMLSCSLLLVLILHHTHTFSLDHE